MILLIYNLKPTRLHYAIALFIIPIKQAKEFVYNTSIASGPRPPTISSARKETFKVFQRHYMLCDIF